MCQAQTGTHPTRFRRREPAGEPSAATGDGELTEAVRALMLLKGADRLAEGGVEGTMLRPEATGDAGFDVDPAAVDPPPLDRRKRSLSEVLRLRR